MPPWGGEEKLPICNGSRACDWRDFGRGIGPAATLARAAPRRLEHDDALSLDMVTAALRADSTDVAIYARVLTQSLGEALPSEFVTVDRDRTCRTGCAGAPARSPGSRCSSATSR